jgi:hypothetical protein
VARPKGRSQSGLDDGVLEYLFTRRTASTGQVSVMRLFPTSRSSFGSDRHKPRQTRGPSKTSREAHTNWAEGTGLGPRHGQVFNGNGFRSSYLHQRVEIDCYVFVGLIVFISTRPHSMHC